MKICDIFLESEIWVCLHDIQVREFNALGPNDLCFLSLTLLATLIENL